jgi:hypothetical protein
MGEYRVAVFGQEVPPVRQKMVRDGRGRIAVALDDGKGKMQIWVSQLIGHCARRAGSAGIISSICGTENSLGIGQRQGQCRRSFSANQQLRMGNPSGRTFVKPSVTGR